MSMVKNLLTWWETSEEENRIRNKNLPTNEKDREENQKIIDIIDEKTFQPGLKTRKEKPRLVERGGVYSKRDLDDKGLGQNKVLYNSSRIKLLIVKLILQAPQRSLR